MWVRNGYVRLQRRRPGCVLILSGGLVFFTVFDLCIGFAVVCGAIYSANLYGGSALQVPVAATSCRGL